MTSLYLLNDYGSDEDSSQDEFREKEDEKQDRLPLPNSLKIIPKEEVIDDPEKHCGRIRSYPHQRGNWNSLIYIPYKRSGPFEILCDQIIELYKPKIELNRIDEPHISLTRTFILLYHWIDNFVVSVKKSLQLFARFEVQFDGLKVYCNEEKTRTFLALSIGFGKMEIAKSVQLLDRCLNEYKLDPFYNEASYHMSILWCLGNKMEELEKYLTEVNNIFFTNLNDTLDLNISIKKYICKIGNKIYNIDLV